MLTKIQNLVVFIYFFVKFIDHRILSHIKLYKLQIMPIKSALKYVDRNTSSTLSSYQKSAQIRARWRDAVYKIFYQEKGRRMDPFAAALLRVKRRQKNYNRETIKVRIVI